MNFLRHPFYTAICIGLLLWVPYANVRGFSAWHSIKPTRWFSSHGSGVNHK